MSKDNLFESLKEIATQRSIGADQLRQMIDDEVRALSSEARVHDYIHVFAIRHLRERMRHLDDEAASETPGHPDDTPVVHARHRL